MNRLIAVALASTLASCTVDNTMSCNADHSYTNQQTFASGLVLEPSQNMHITSEQVNQYYGETQACLGLSAAEGPVVEFVSFDEYFNGRLGSPWAIFVYGGYIFMNTDENPPAGIVRDCDTDRQAIKHEFIHHVLADNGLDWSHSNPLFQACGVGVNTSN